MKLLMLCAAFFRIGLFGFGGGLAMLPLIYQSVQEFGFMSAAEFSNLLALSQVTPGPIAVNAATYVGLQYADTEAHLESLKIKQERYQELLKEATEMEDIITLESALSDVEYEIEWYSSDLNRYDSLISYSTIDINLTEVLKETNVPTTGDFGERVQNAFGDGLDGFVEGWQGFVVFLAYAALPLIIWAAVIIAALLIIRKFRKKAKAAGKAPQAPAADPGPDHKTEP